MAVHLLAGAALGLSVAVPPGPVSLVCVQQSLNSGFRHGLMAGLGAALAHGIFATTAFAEADFVSLSMGPWFSVIRVISAGILIYLGIRTIVRARSEGSPFRTATLPAVLFSTFMLTLSNPMTIIPYLAFATAETGDSSANAAFSLWSVPGVILAAAAWYTGLSFASVQLRSGMSGDFIKVLDWVAGSSLIGFGALIGRDLLSILASG
jgi:threonine/homoserine/homoserine lactone efflux protein